MKIKNIKINQYGNLENKEIDLENKINIIYGKNESGKSTLLNYIKNAFYGISKNKNGKEISDYEKYKPWVKEEFSGKIKYELDNGNTYEIFRDFHKKNPKIFNEYLEDITTQFNIDKKEGSQFFYEQTKVDEVMFLSTIVAMQQEVKLDKQSQSVLVQKLANLVGTGEDDISFKKVIEKLNKKQLEEIGTDRTQEKPINIVKDKMKKIEIAIKDMDTYQKNKEEIQLEKQIIKKEIENLEIKDKISSRLNQINIENNLENEKNKLKENIENEIQEKIEKLKTEKQELKKDKKEKKSKTKNIIMFIVFIALFIAIQLINRYFIKNNIVNILSYMVFPIYLIYFIIQNKNDKTYNQKIINVRIEEIEKQINSLQNEKQKTEEEIKNSNIKMQEKIEKENQEIKQKYNINDISLDKIEEQKLEIQEKISEQKLKLQAIEIEEKNITNNLENMITLKEEYKELEEEYKQLQEKNEIILLSKDYLNKAYEQMKNSITPKFMQNLSETISNISDGKYKNVSINEENGIIVENEYGEYIPVERLSVGTIDQLYLSLRLSMIKEISEENMPIILDEAFAYYDTERLEKVLVFLAEKSQNNQVIIFTCTKREKEILDKLQIHYNLVEL